MTRSKESILQFIDCNGGEVDSHPIIDAFSALDTAYDLVNDGMLERVLVPGGLDHFRLTQAGREKVRWSQQSRSDEMP